MTPLVLMGPTASGKSALALALAKKRDIAIINADSKQVYREIPVITAQPSAEDMAQAPHFLYGHISAVSPYDVSQWAQEAARVIAECRRQGRAPLLVGGTGMYIDALLHGVSPAPAAPADMVAELRELAESRGAPHIRGLLEKCDPESAARLSAADAPRLIRALAVYRATGVGISQWNARPRVRFLPEADAGAAIIFSLERDRAMLYARAEQRFKAMMANGALAEAERYARLCAENNISPSAKAHGLPELLALLKGEITEAEAYALATRNTRRYIKRQFTWMRHQLPSRLPLLSEDDKECVQIMEARIF